MVFGSRVGSASGPMPSVSKMGAHAAHTAVHKHNQKVYKKSTNFGNNYKIVQKSKKDIVDAGRSDNSLMYLAIFAASVTVYANSLCGDLVHDDIYAITNNPDARGDTSVWQLFSNDFWGRSMADNASHKSYRPITMLSFR